MDVGGSHTALLDFNVKAPATVKSDGEIGTSKIEDGKLLVELEAAPKYVTLR
jgi:hypothetical protein